MKFESDHVAASDASGLPVGPIHVASIPSEVALQDVRSDPLNIGTRTFGSSVATFGGNFQRGYPVDTAAPAAPAMTVRATTVDGLTAQAFLASVQKSFKASPVDIDGLTAWSFSADEQWYSLLYYKAGVLVEIAGKNLPAGSLLAAMRTVS